VVAGLIRETGDTRLSFSYTSRADEGRDPLTPPQPTSGHGANVTFDEEETTMGAKRRTPAPGSVARSDRVFIAVEADSTDEELEAMAEAVAKWIEERDPNFFWVEEGSKD
jgi:hypothetical protein